jgi:hypothetical protein
MEGNVFSSRQIDDILLNVQRYEPKIRQGETFMVRSAFILIYCTPYTDHILIHLVVVPK